MASIREIPVAMEDCAVIMLGDQAEELLGVWPPIDPHAVQMKIEHVLQEVFNGAHGSPPTERLIASLGVFWGNMITVAYDWDWVALVNGDWRGLGVADKQRKYLALPIDFFNTLILKDTNRTKPGPAVLFKAIGENYLPESKPGQFLILAD